VKKFALAFAFLMTMTTATAAHAATTAKLAASAFPLPVPQTIATYIEEAAAKYHVDPNLIAAVAFRESRFKALDTSWRGAQGVMQLMPKTARALGVTDVNDPRQNILAGTKYLKMMLDRFDGDLDRSLAAYNAGPELVAKVGPTATKEAVDYVAAVKSFYSAALAAL
jgi:soluble lytic murein transglycosylase-like protein